MNLKPFNPNSWPCRPGIEIKTNKEDITKALDELRLEDAKFAIYHCHGGNYSIATKEKLLLIVQKLAELNAQPLSDEHKKLNYCLEAAYSLGCHMYTNSKNVKNPYASDKMMKVAVGALKMVADCFAKKNKFSKAVDCLNRLDNSHIYLRDIMLEKWKTYIDNDCLPENKERQNFLYNLRNK